VEKTNLLDVEALGRAHTDLLDDLRRLEGADRPASGAGPSELESRLAATQAHITEHFRFEEEGGYMDALRKDQPHLERAILQLAAEHRELAQAVAALLEQARAVRDLDGKVRDAVREWIARVRRHETRENQLVQDAFNRDIGSDD
jgi:hemerythrin-like domain-containing protein